MQTEFIVPDLKDFELQPYVPYDKVANITKGQHTAREYFDAVYADRIKQKFYAEETDQENIDTESFLKDMLTQKDEVKKK
ncbi:large ribosomal subunit protein mL41-like [Ruditapes philippinarum]|uniref:large ribosomal subunit protein mL41-like n=1 Tax=Ruditapes philippinarum TaxID=129788 RepID=UPI00295C13FF|nr:large ribosomal subunit protein mL41-like [Ruditapes philippinarum]XP_060606191.1 large ribosomal subunit protein mL41-like [Ruditapes philippinarum]